MELIHGYVQFVLSISRPLPNKTMLKFDQNFKACVSGRLIYLLKSYLLGLHVVAVVWAVILANAFNPWVWCAFGNV